MEYKSTFHRYFYLFKTFLLIGSTSFGGYMSLIAMVRNKMVVRDKTVNDDLITEGISLASMLPGPAAVNVVTYVGFNIAGLPGALLSMLSVLLPSFVLVLSLTYFYLYAGDAVQIDDILKGIFPVVAGIIFSTGTSMGQKICTNWKHYAIAAISFVVVFLFKSYWSIVMVLVLSAVAGIVIFRTHVDVPLRQSREWKPVVMWLCAFTAVLVAVSWLSSGTLLGDIFRQFSTVSLSLFGGGYVMIPIMKSVLVDQLGWITDQEFIYGISIGQVTPGPILISATFFGFKLAGFTGAVVATLAIFAPSAILMLMLSVIFDVLKQNRFVQSALMGIKPCVVGMILYSGVSIVITHIENTYALVTITLTALSFFLVFRFNTSNVLLIIGGALAGYLLY
ncbi:chromate efflux transporter [Chryseolinea sp. T2]|uniref:chromate efflux transporter n=1 Tax=Chryseolinea sp. T2 TaxID=3129255 RepID=UPI0030768A1F